MQRDQDREPHSPLVEVAARQNAPPRIAIDRVSVAETSFIHCQRHRRPRSGPLTLTLPECSLATLSPSSAERNSRAPCRNVRNARRPRNCYRPHSRQIKQPASPVPHLLDQEEDTHSQTALIPRYRATLCSSASGMPSMICCSRPTQPATNRCLSTIATNAPRRLNQHLTQLADISSKLQTLHQRHVALTTSAHRCGMRHCMRHEPVLLPQIQRLLATDTSSPDPHAQVALREFRSLCGCSTSPLFDRAPTQCRTLHARPPTLHA